MIIRSPNDRNTFELDLHLTRSTTENDENNYQLDSDGDDDDYHNNNDNIDDIKNIS